MNELDKWVTRDVYDFNDFFFRFVPRTGGLCGFFRTLRLKLTKLLVIALNSMIEMTLTKQHENRSASVRV